MKRKITVLTLCAMLFALCMPATAQPQEKVPRVGFLSTASLPPCHPGLMPFVKDYGTLVMSKGKTSPLSTGLQKGIPIDFLASRSSWLVSRWTGSSLRDPVRLVPPGKPPARSRSCMTNPGNPVQPGLVASLARPGGNITGLSSMSIDLAGKRLELLKETIPQLFRAAIFSDPRGEDRCPKRNRERVAVAKRTAHFSGGTRRSSSWKTHSDPWQRAVYTLSSMAAADF